MLERKATISRKGINLDERTADLVFSSEEPVEDWPGFSHVLSHDDGAVDLARLNDGAAVLVNHNYNDHVGVVERAWVGDDRKGRATVRFGESARANEIWKDVSTGIRRHVSVGAELLETAEPEDTGGGKVIRVTRWRPAEVSIASVPADTSAGIGRTKQEPKMSEHAEQPHEAVIAKERQRAAKDVSARINDIYAIGEEYNCMDVAREYATLGKTSDDDLAKLRREAFDAYYKAQMNALEEAKTQTPVGHLDLSPGEVQRFSVTRALNAVLENRPQDAAFEFECSKEIERAIDRPPNGIFIPHDVQMRDYKVNREMNTGTPGTGAEYVGTLHDWGNFIEQLRVNVVAIAAGATMLPGLRQNLDIPRKDTGASFQWLAEGGAVTLSDLGTGNVQLTPTTVAGGVKSTRRMLKQSLPAIDDLIMQDLAEGAAEAIDLAIMEGTGASNQPTGIVNQPGVNTQIVNPAGEPTWDEIVGFETAVGNDNALRGALRYITTTAVTGFCKTQEKSTGSGRFIMEAEQASPFGPTGTINGYPVSTSNALSTGRIIFGDWSQVLVGMWGVLDLRPDPYTAADEDALIIRAFQDMDTDVRHAVSFCINTLT